MKYILVFLADWANGLLAVLTASWLLGISPEWWHFLIGIAFSHSPDLDAIPEIFRHGKVGASESQTTDHREGLHYPLLWLIGGGALASIYGYWGLVFLFATTLHFLNDFYGTGWGIKLLWPLTNRNYKLLGRRVNRLKSILVDQGDWPQLRPEERKLRLVVSWRKEELPEYFVRWGMSDWVEDYYLKLNWISGVEYCVFIVAVLLTYLSLT